MSSTYWCPAKHREVGVDAVRGRARADAGNGPKRAVGASKAAEFQVIRAKSITRSRVVSIRRALEARFRVTVEGRSEAMDGHFGDPHRELNLRAVAGTTNRRIGRPDAFPDNASNRPNAIPIPIRSRHSGSAAHIAAGTVNDHASPLRAEALSLHWQATGEIHSGVCSVPSRRPLHNGQGTERRNLCRPSLDAVVSCQHGSVAAPEEGG